MIRQLVVYFPSTKSPTSIFISPFQTFDLIILLTPVYSLGQISDCPSLLCHFVICSPPFHSKLTVLAPNRPIPLLDAPWTTEFHILLRQSTQRPKFDRMRLQRLVLAPPHSKPSHCITDSKPPVTDRRTLASLTALPKPPSAPPFSPFHTQPPIPSISSNPH